MNKYPHEPPHIFSSKGTYIVTAATLYKRKMFDTNEKLDILEEFLLSEALEHEWDLKA